MSELEKLKQENEELRAQLEEKRKLDFQQREAERIDYMNKLKAGDPEAAQKFMHERTVATQYEQSLHNQQRLEYEQRQQREIATQKEEKLQKRLSKLTPEQKKARADSFEQLEMKQKEEVLSLENEHTENIDIIESFFKADKDSFLKYYKELDAHIVEESPVGKLIKGEKMEYQCVLDNEERVYVWDIDRQPHYYFTYANTVNTVEWHAYNHRPQVHKDYLIDLENTEYATKLNKLKEEHSKQLKDAHWNF